MLPGILSIFGVDRSLLFAPNKEYRIWNQQYGIYLLLNKLTINNITTAPISAVTMELSMLVPMLISRALKITPPRIPPAIPRKKLIRKPKPRPFIINPARNPARAPTIINAKKFID